MIILTEKRDDINYLHLIIGEETEFQFNLNGYSSIDITDYVKNSADNEHTLLVINRCESETEILEILSREQGKMQFQKMIQESFEKTQPQQQTQPQIIQKPESKNKSKCVLCGNKLSSSDKLGVCETCKQIENGIKKTAPVDDIPMPTRDDLKRIREDLLQDYPDQKNNIDKFISDKKKKPKKEDSDV